MELFWNIPIFFKVLGVFTLILALIRKNVQLGTAFFSGALLLGGWCRMTPLKLAQSIGLTLIDPKTLLVAAMVGLILILSRSMETLHQMKRLLTSLQGTITNVKAQLIVFPALIGLLPMPGGAIFSAPMVEEVGKQYGIDAETKSLLNYWFRHVWELFWPLYPGMILATSLAGFEFWTLVLRGFPLSLFSTLLGYLFLLRPLHLPKTEGELASKPSEWRTIFREVAPILFVVIASIGGSLSIAFLKGSFPAIEQIPTEIPLIVALLVSIALVWRMNRATQQIIVSAVWNKPLLNMLYMTFGIFAFKGVLVESRAVENLSAFFIALHVPLMLLVMLIPFIAGSIAGVALGFVGTSFPVLLSLLHTMGLEPPQTIPYLVLAYCSGFTGMMFSPLHVCFALTREYFNADFGRLYRRLWLPLTLLMLGGAAYFFILRYLGGN